MAKEISLQDQDLNRFILDEKGRVQTYLRKNFSVSDEDLEDIFQEASMALFLNVRDGKLSKLTGSLGTYFMKVCINQTLKFINRRSKTIQLFNESLLFHSDMFRSDKIDELYNLCTDDEEAERKTRNEKLVGSILEAMTETCKNILRSYYWDDFSASTIADMFNFSDANSVKTQKYKCVKKFREKYNELKNRIYG